MNGREVLGRVLERFVLGCAPLGGLYAALDDDTAAAMLRAAWDLGVRHFDTAPHYGAGLSERRLGAFLREHPREEYTVSTKVGRLLVDIEEDSEGDTDDTEGAESFVGGDRKRRVRDYSRDGVLRSLEESLARLGLDRVDTVYVHDPDDFVDEAVTQACPALVELREAGVVRHVGAGMNAVAPLLRIVRETAVDQVLVAGRYTLLDRSAGEELLPLCHGRGIRVVAGGVYNSGLLADPRPGARYDYAPADDATLGRALRLRELCEAHGVPLRAAAVQFPLGHPAVTAVAVGCRDAREVRDAVRMLGTPLPAALGRALATA
jgi:D-threo-aldose 1-dehydrogenase